MATLTASARYDYLNCQRQFLYKHVWRIQPHQDDEGEALFVGKMFHEALDARAKGNHYDWPIPAEHRERERILKTKAMFIAYCSQWGVTEPIEHAELEFNVPLVPGVRLLGKVDGLAGRTLIENKTATEVGPEYFERLPFDGQLHSYITALERCGIQITTVRYDVTTRPRISLQVEESEDEFNLRYAAACAANKNGKSTATRRMGETDEEFINRCLPLIQCIRDEFIIGDADRAIFRDELILLAKELRLKAKKPHTAYLRNDRGCNQWHRTCPYMPLCRNNVDTVELAKRMGYVDKEPHKELSRAVVAWKGGARCFR